ncbi:YhdP family protein [Azospirillum sp. sgz301742]
MIRRTAKILSWTVSLAVAAVLAAGGALVWRLGQGPVALDPLTPYIEQALAGDDGRVTVSIGSLVLSWTNETETGSSILDLRAQQVRASSAEGAPIAAVPEMGIGLSLRELLLGRLAPTRLDLIRPQLRVIRHKDGHLGFDIRDAEVAPEPESGSEVASGVLDTLRRAPDRKRPLGLLRRLTVVGADLRVDNRQFGLAWHASRADIALHRGAEGIEGRARLTLDLGGRPTAVEATGAYRTQDGTTSALVRVDGLDLASLAQVAPVLEPLRDAEVPVGGSLAAVLDPDFRPSRVRFDLNAGVGSLRLPVRPEPYAVRSAHVRGELDLSARRLTLDDLALALAEAQVSGNGTLMDEPDGPIGEAKLTLTAGGRTAALHATATPGHGGPRVVADVKGLEPAALAGLAPDLAPFAAVTLPIAGSVEVDLDRHFRPRSGRVDLSAGAGTVDVPGMFEAPLALASVALRASGDRDADRLAVEALSVDLGGPTIQATAQAGLRGDDLTLNAEATARGVSLSDLHLFWPLKMSPNARNWVSSNLTKGIVHEARATVAGTAPRDNPDAFTPTLVDVAMEGTDMDVEYFRPLPPVTGVSRVRATVDTGRTMTIHTQGGRVEDAKMGDGTIVIHDLGGKEKIDIDLPIQGPVRTILTVLNNPPLEYPKRLDMDPRRTTGMADARLRLHFPLLVDLKVDQIEVGVGAKLTGVGIEKVAAGLDATDGTLDLNLDVKGMAVKGTAKLDGVPASVDWRENFVSDAKGPRTRIALKATPNAADFARFIPNPAGYAGGPVGTDILFTVDQRKRLGLSGTLDLAKTTLAIPELGWSKPPGTAATGRFALEFQKDKVAKVTGITVEGGGLKAAGTVELVPATTSLARILVGDLSVGNTRARGELVPRDGGYAVTLTGDSLDVEAFLKKTRGSSDAAEPKRTPLAVNAKLGRVVFGEGRQLTQVVADMRNDGTAWSKLDIKAKAGEKGALTVTYGPQPGKRHQLAIVGEDAGTVLRMLDVTDRVQGGQLNITGLTTEPRPDAVIEGQVEMLDYTLVNAPTLARILNAISPSGFAELLGGGPGIHFGRLTGNFRKEGRLLTLKELRTSGSALGLTAEGEVDIATDTANLRGTIVPVYGINRIIGQIPLLGDALSGGAGQGIFAATWHVQGPFADPNVSVNPLAVLAPGFLRNLFFMGRGMTDGKTDGQATPPDYQHRN